MNTDLFKDLDTALNNAATSRRDALRKAGRLGGAAALSVLPLYGMAKKAMASNYGFNPEDDFDILNYALTLEFLESYFYQMGVDSGVIASADRPLFETINRDEAAHVQLLSGAITQAGGTPVSYQPSDFDFTAGGMFPAFTDYQTFLILSQGFEDTGVRAYKGQAANIESKTYLTVALQIHSVEARHAAAVRRVRGSNGWITNDNGPDPIAAVYGPGNPAAQFPSEANETQGGVDLGVALSSYTMAEITEAFDEPLDMQTVIGIAAPFADFLP